ncbi:hypothetical protein [Caballeronia sp. GAWG1-1]|uniref:hypothetical protein n=1 Tax=Caballeronia sp. GAWG1-1 TaxID=2921742 RepID=UPI00202872DB|nr:hypothetical protein [Caballeronia sp. GAWG1-1]
MEEAKRVFDYDAFSKKSEKGWNAYELTKSSSHRLCPYCQQAYAFTIVARTKGKKGNKVIRGFRPTLDHYYPKSEYPFLGLSLYNLVPACQTCNSSLKSTKNFYTNPHLHPLRDPECLRFKLDPISYLLHRADSSVSLRIELEIINASLAAEAKASIDTFLLDKRYHVHDRELGQFFASLQRWTPDLIAKLAADQAWGLGSQLRISNHCCFNLNMALMN